MSYTSTKVPLKTRTKKNKFFIYQRIIDRVFRPMRKGALRIALPDGGLLAYGSGRGGVEAEMTVKDNAFFRKCVLFGDVGFGESYVDGDWETPDITKVIEWMIQNVEDHPTLMADRPKKRPVNILKFLNNVLTPFRANSIRGSKKNIQQHYDLGNEFYKLFLDPTMTYSSAYFKSSDQDLEQAQIQKYDELCQKLRLRHNDHVLEIGSGWGGFSMHAARNYGCRVTTVTISEEQFRHVREKVLDEGLVERIDIELCDYRRLTGKYDKIVSIEMIEAVGHKYYPTFFRQCHALLKQDGLLALQMILAPDHRYESFRKNMDWIQKHIFPGSLLPSMSALMNAINSTSDLTLFDYEDITSHYAKTLAIWHRNFSNGVERVKALGFDKTFIRKWHYYLSYCEAAFKTRNISVAQAVFTRPNNLELTS